MNWKIIWNWQPDCVEDSANGGIYVGNWLSWGFMSPLRPATCRQIDQRQNRQLDQRFQKTWLPDDSQPTASRYAVLWPCHRDNVVIVMVGQKNLRKLMKNIIENYDELTFIYDWQYEYDFMKLHIDLWCIVLFVWLFS